jgi:hypothetical protein
LNSQLTSGYFRFVEYKKEVGGGAMDWKRLLAYITGSEARELPLRNEDLVVENRILRNKARQEGTSRSLASRWVSLFVSPLSVS